METENIVDLFDANEENCAILCRDKQCGVSAGGCAEHSLPTNLCSSSFQQELQHLPTSFASLPSMREIYHRSITYARLDE
jgi:hypothetical protein